MVNVSDKTIVVEPSNPVYGEKGVAAVPEGISFQGNLISNPSIPVSELNKMLNTDGEVAGVYRILTVPIRGAQFRITKKHGRGKREATFIEEIFRNKPREGGMLTPMSMVMGSICRMLIDGYAPHEIVWSLRDGFVRVDKIAHRPPVSIGIKTDDHNNIIKYTQNLGMVPGANLNFKGGKHEVEIPKDKILHFVHGPEWNATFGNSLFKTAYYHYEKKHKLYYISHIAAQINALKMRILRGADDKGQAEIEEMVKLVAGLGFNSTLHLPEGWELEILDNTGSTFDTLPLIQHHDTQISKSVLAQVLDIGTEGANGSFNLSSTHFDIFITNLELITKEIANVFNNDLIPRLIDWNFGTDAYPTLTFQPFDRDAKARLADLFQRLASAKSLNVTQQFMLELEQQIAETLGLEVDYAEIEKMLEVDPTKVYPTREPVGEDDDDPDEGDNNNGN